MIIKGVIQFLSRLSTWVLGVSWHQIHVKPSGKCQETTGIKSKKMVMEKYLCVAFLPLHQYLQQTKNLVWVLAFIFKPVILLNLLHFVWSFLGLMSWFYS